MSPWRRTLVPKLEPKWFKKFEPVLGKEFLEFGSAGLKTGSIILNQIGSKNVNQNVSHGEHFGQIFGTILVPFFGTIFRPRYLNLNSRGAKTHPKREPKWFQKSEPKLAPRAQFWFEKTEPKWFQKSEPVLNPKIKVSG